MVGSLRQRVGLACNGSHEKMAFAHLFRDTSKEKHMGPKWGQSWEEGSNRLCLTAYLALP